MNKLLLTASWVGSVRAKAAAMMAPLPMPPQRINVWLSSPNARSGTDPDPETSDERHRADYADAESGRGLGEGANQEACREQSLAPRTVIGGRSVQDRCIAGRSAICQKNRPP